MLNDTMLNFFTISGTMISVALIFMAWLWVTRDVFTEETGQVVDLILVLVIVIGISALGAKLGFGWS